MTAALRDEERQREYRERVDIIVAADVKRNYSKALYIGNPDWAAARYREVREIAAAKRQAMISVWRGVFRRRLE